MFNWQNQSFSEVHLSDWAFWIKWVAIVVSYEKSLICHARLSFTFAFVRAILIENRLGQIKHVETWSSSAVTVTLKDVKCLRILSGSSFTCCFIAGVDVTTPSSHWDSSSTSADTPFGHSVPFNSCDILVPVCWAPEKLRGRKILGFGDNIGNISLTPCFFNSLNVLLVPQASLVGDAHKDEWPDKETHLDNIKDHLEL